MRLNGRIQALKNRPNGIESRIGVLLNKLHLIIGGQFFVEGSRHTFPSEIYVARSGTVQPRDNLPERRLPAARFAHERNDFPFGNIETHVF